MVNWLPTAWFALQFEAPAVCGDNLFHDRETDARALDAAALRLLAPVELGENRRPLARRDADAAVAHGDGEVLPSARRTHLDGAVVGRVLDGVVQQVPHRPRQGFLVCLDLHGAITDALDDSSRRLHVLPEFLDHLADESCAIAPLEAVLARPGLHPPEIEERFDEPGQPVGGARLGVVAHPAAVVAEVFVFAQHVRELPQRREGRSELVRHGGHEIGFQARDRQFAADGDENQDAGRQRQQGRQSEARHQKPPPLCERLLQLQRADTGDCQVPGQSGVHGSPGCPDRGIGSDRARHRDGR